MATQLKLSKSAPSRPHLFSIFEVVVGTFVFFVLAILCGLLLASSKPVVLFNMGFSYEEGSRIPLYELNENAVRTLQYVRGTGDEKTLIAPLPSGHSYTENEISHLRDVRLILQPALWAVLPFALVALTFIIRGFYGSKAVALHKSIKTAAWSLMVFMGALFLIGFVSFNFLFEKFHILLFPQGNWTFSWDSLLIQTFPLQFWINSALAVLLGIVFMIVGYRVLATLLIQYGKSCN